MAQKNAKQNMTPEEKKAQRDAVNAAKAAKKAEAAAKKAAKLAEEDEDAVPKDKKPNVKISTEEKKVEEPQPKIE